MAWAAVASATPAPAPPPAPVAPTTGQTVAVLDANALISGFRHAAVAERAVTIAEVLEEVRDPAARAALAAPGRGVDVLAPTDESVQAGAAGGGSWGGGGGVEG